MTDREMLELAAKAAGLKEYGWMADTLTHVVNNQFVFWDPLNDDGAALRLAVSCNIDVWQDYGVGETGTNYMLPGVEIIGYNLRQEWGEIGQLAATRHVIVRTAAEIGKAMP